MKYRLQIIEHRDDGIIKYKPVNICICEALLTENDSREYRQALGEQILKAFDKSYAGSNFTVHKIYYGEEKP